MSIPKAIGSTPMIPMTTRSGEKPSRLMASKKVSKCSQEDGLDSCPPPALLGSQARAVTPADASVGGELHRSPAFLPHRSSQSQANTMEPSRKRAFPKE